MTLTLPSPSPQSPCTPKSCQWCCLNTSQSTYFSPYPWPPPQAADRLRGRGKRFRDIIGCRPLTGWGCDALVSSFHSGPLPSTFHTVAGTHFQNASLITSQKDQILSLGSLPDCTREPPTSWHRIPLPTVLAGARGPHCLSSPESWPLWEPFILRGVQPRCNLKPHLWME